MKIKRLLDGTPINKQQFLKWVEALESGEFQQARGRLQVEGGFCCLGVACKVLIDEDKLERSYKNCIAGETVHDQIRAPEWLKFISLDVLRRWGTSLTTANDEEGFSFKDIAQGLRDTYIDNVFSAKDT